MEDTRVQPRVALVNQPHLFPEVEYVHIAAAVADEEPLVLVELDLLDELVVVVQLAF